MSREHQTTLREKLSPQPPRHQLSLSLAAMLISQTKHPPFLVHAYTTLATIYTSNTRLCTRVGLNLFLYLISTLKYFLSTIELLLETGFHSIKEQFGRILLNEIKQEFH